MNIESPVAGAPPHNPMEQIGSEGSFRGRLVYIPFIQVEEKAQAQRYFVFESLGGPRLLNNDVTPTVHYRESEALEDVRDPQFSPDGNLLLFKEGLLGPSIIADYDAYVWNFRARALKKMDSPQAIRFNDMFWSPDSHHIAFAVGSERDGGITDYGNLTRLYIYNVQTGKSHLVVQNPAATQMAWTHQNTLLFTQTSLSTEALQRLEAAQTGSREQKRLQAKLHPSIYEVGVDGGIPRKLISEGFSPRSSPDGKWIAFLGRSAKSFALAKPAQNEEDEPRYNIILPTERMIWNRRVSSDVGLYLWNVQTHKRRLIGPANFNWFEWTPDSRHLVTLKETFSLVSPNRKGRVRTLTIPSLSLRTLSTLQTQDVSLPLSVRKQIMPSKSEFGLSFQPQVSDDGRFVFVKTYSATGAENRFTTFSKSLLAFNLQSGKSQVLARLGNRYDNIIGWDFHDDSPIWKPTRR